MSGVTMSKHVNHAIRGLAALACIFVIAPSAPPTAQAAGPTVKQKTKTPYYKGRSRVGLSGGVSGSFSGSPVLQIQGSFGYFFVDNLEAGLDAAVAFSDPFIAQLGPALRYYVPVTRELHPYFGAFYLHQFVGNDQDDDGFLGARLGIALKSGGVNFQLGAAYLYDVIDCEEDCGQFIPEFGISMFL